eukprot:9851-Heterococcus_DN1.PRE.1
MSSRVVASSVRRTALVNRRYSSTQYGRAKRAHQHCLRSVSLPSDKLQCTCNTLPDDDVVVKDELEQQQQRGSSAMNSSRSNACSETSVHVLVCDCQ